MMPLTKQRVFITGGAGGLGSAIAAEFANQGAAVTCASRSNDVAEAIANPPTNVVHDRADVNDPESLNAAVDRAVARWGGLDVLVTCAGRMVDGKAAEIDLTAADDMLRTNVLGTLAAVQAATPSLRASGAGRIITMSSAIARVATRGTSVYAATKAAIEALTRTLAAELGPEIRVNALAPGFVSAGLAAGIVGSTTLWPLYQNHIALRRPATPEEIARAAVFLASPTNTYVNGSVLSVDGGLTWP